LTEQNAQKSRNLEIWDAIRITTIAVALTYGVPVLARGLVARGAASCIMTAITQGGVMRYWAVTASIAIVLVAPQFALGDSGIGKGRVGAPPFPHAVEAGAPGPSGGVHRAQPGGIHYATVTGVDSAAMTFNCHGAEGDETFQVTQSTKIRRGNDMMGFGDLRSGGNLQVIFHLNGQTKIADLVVLSY
jgi:hypothetical protein